MNRKNLIFGGLIGAFCLFAAFMIISFGLNLISEIIGKTNFDSGIVGEKHFDSSSFSRTSFDNSTPEATAVSVARPNRGEGFDMFLVICSNQRN